MSQSYQMKKFGQTYDAMFDEALQIVEYEARRILKAHPNLDEFIMGMGDYSFTRKKYDHLNAMTVDNVKYITESKLALFIDDYDRYIRITGTPMRFTAHGKMIKDW